jgi:hypothetical protein
MLDIIQQVALNCAHLLSSATHVTNTTSASNANVNPLSSIASSSGQNNALLSSLFASFLTVDESSKLTQACAGIIVQHHRVIIAVT